MLVLTPILYLAFARAFVAITPDNIVAIQLTNRSIADVGLIALLPLAVLLAAPRRFAVARRPSDRLAPAPDEPGAASWRTPRSRWRWRSPSCSCRPASTATVPRRSSRPPSLQAMATELTALVPPGARFATQRLPAQERALTGMSHPDLWLAWATGANTLNIYNLESSVVFEPVYEAEHLNDRPPAEVAERLARLGVSHLAVIDTLDVPGLMSSAAFSPVWADGTMAILQVHPAAGQPAPADLVTAGSPIRATLVGADPQHLVVETDVDRADGGDVRRRVVAQVAGDRRRHTGAGRRRARTSSSRWRCRPDRRR